MRWLIDGYNVIRRDPALSAREEEGLPAGRAALLRRLAALARDHADAFTVVFDGARLRAQPDSGASAAGRVEVVFSRPPESADDVLRRLAAGGTIVVSSDRAVATAAWRAGAVAVGVDEFLAALARTGEDEAGDDGEDDEDDARPRRGNPRRPSREVREARRVLRRLQVRR